MNTTSISGTVAYWVNSISYLFSIIGRVISGSYKLLIAITTRILNSLNLYDKKTFTDTFFSLFNSQEIHGEINLPKDFNKLLLGEEFNCLYDPSVILAIIFLLYLFFDHFSVRLKYSGILNSYFCQKINQLIMFYEYSFDLLFPFYLAPVLYFLSAFFNDPNFSLLKDFTSESCNHAVLIESRLFYASLQLLNLCIVGFMLYKFFNTRISKRFSQIWWICRIFIFPLILVPVYFGVHAEIYRSIGLHPMLIFFKEPKEAIELYIAFGVLLSIIYTGFILVVLPLSYLKNKALSYLKNIAENLVGLMKLYRK